MRGANSNKPMPDRSGRSQRQGFSLEVRLVGGEAGRQLEREQSEAIIEVLGWVAANPGPTTDPTHAVPGW
jgi:hypothetical protein